MWTLSGCVVVDWSSRRSETSWEGGCDWCCQEEPPCLPTRSASWTCASVALSARATAWQRPVGPAPCRRVSLGLVFLLVAQRYGREQLYGWEPGCRQWQLFAHVFVSCINWSKAGCFPEMVSSWTYLAVMLNCDFLLYCCTHCLCLAHCRNCPYSVK